MGTSPYHGLTSATVHALAAAQDLAVCYTGKAEGRRFGPAPDHNNLRASSQCSDQRKCLPSAFMPITSG